MTAGLVIGTIWVVGLISALWYLFHSAPDLGDDDRVILWKSCPGCGESIRMTIDTAQTCPMCGEEVRAEPAEPHSEFDL